MGRRSAISPSASLKSLRHVGGHPWIVNKMIRLQLAKRFFPLFRAQLAAGRGGRIHQVSIRITDLCNLRCTTCGQWGPSGYLLDKPQKELKANEVPPDRYGELFADLVYRGHHPNVYIWGGEPTLYPGLLEVIRSATALGLPTSIATNGHRLAALTQELVDIPLFLAQISIDGPDAETHNRLRVSTRSGNSFDDIQAGLAALRRARSRRGRSLPLIASLTVVSEGNYRHLADIYRRFRDEVDLMVFYLSWWITPERADQHENDFAARFGFEPALHRGWIGGWLPGDVGLLHDQLGLLRKMSRPWGNPPVVVIPALRTKEELRKYYQQHEELFGYDQCISIHQAVEIDSNGDMSPCRDYHDYMVGNVKEKTITELWNNQAFRKFRQSLHQKGLMHVCSRCCGLMGF